MEFTSERYRLGRSARSDSRSAMRDINSFRMDFSSNAAARVGWGREEDNAGKKRRVTEKHPVAGQKEEKGSVFSDQGIRWDAATVILLALIVFFGVFLMAEAGNMILTRNRVEELQTEYDSVLASNREMEVSLSRQTDDSQIGYQAVSMGLVSTLGEKPISLIAPEDAVMVMPALGLTGI